MFPFGQMRTSPPRSRRKVATDFPAASSAPLATLMPVPASSTGPCAVLSEANNSPIVCEDWAPASIGNTRAASASGLEIFLCDERTGAKDLILDIVFVNGNGDALSIGGFFHAHHFAHAMDPDGAGESYF